MFRKFKICGHHHKIKLKLKLKKCVFFYNCFFTRSYIRRFFYHWYLQVFYYFLEPLHEFLLKETNWKWAENKNSAFENAKNSSSLAKLLVHYDNKKPLVLVCDASPCELGAASSTVLKDGSEKPIAFTSWTLTMNYSQIKKQEKKICHYIFGWSFKIITDNKTLTVQAQINTFHESL